MITLETANASRKAERIFIADAFCEIGERHGAKIERREEPRHVGWSGPGILLDFTLNGVGGLVDIDNLHGGDHSVLSWYNAYGGEHRAAKHFAPRFNRAAGDFQPRPHHKATTVANWAEMATILDECLGLAASRQAFIEDIEREAA